MCNPLIRIIAITNHARRAPDILRVTPEARRAVRGPMADQQMPRPAVRRVDPGQRPRRFRGDAPKKASQGIHGQPVAEADSVRNARRAAPISTLRSTL